MSSKNSMLLADAIADAKAVRQTALENAKQALLEAFAPKMQSMLSTKIREEAEETEEELPAEEAPETTEVAPEEAPEAEVPAEEAPAEEEDLDLESIIRELEGSDAPQDAISDEELDLDEVIASLSEEEVPAEEAPAEEAPAEADLTAENAQLKTELKEAINVITQLRTQLKEINLVNAKMLYLQKIYHNNKQLTEAQQNTVLDAIDRATNVREAKLIYATLTEHFNASKATPSKPKSKKSVSLKESFASAPTAGTKRILPEGAEIVSRFQELAKVGNFKRK